jgi:hypothetical protein
MDTNQNEYFQFILKYSNKPWDWLEITKNSYITIDIVEANPNNIPWNWWGLSANPNITMEFVEANMDKPWDWQGLSENPNITMEFVEANIELLGINRWYCKNGRDCK